MHNIHIVILALILLISCNGTEIHQDSDSDNNETVYQDRYDALNNTKWKHVKTDFKKDGHPDLVEDRKQYIGGTIFFKDGYCYLNDETEPTGEWRFFPDGGLYMERLADLEINYNLTYFVKIFANIFQEELSSNKLILRSTLSAATTQVVYLDLVGSFINSGNEEGYEEPFVGILDWTSTQKSLNIQYKIYNQDESKVNSATIYYGKSVNNISYKQNASVIGDKIKVTIKGLEPGTTYYIKCVAKGKGGEYTTEITKCLTLYED